MTRLLLISDTHLPTRARALPHALWAEVDRADAVLHAGDWVDEALLDELTERATYVIGVWGNNDGPGLRARLPEVARFDLHGLRFAMTHETGDAPTRARRMDALYPDTDVLIFGHSHIPWDTTTPGGLRLVNPGSPTDRRRQPTCTYMTADVADSGITVELHHLPPAR
ncbi:YfcE family phosphodiesterase [soil metagenome]